MLVRKNIKLMHWNAQSITDICKQIELEKFLKLRQIDILLLNETYLDSKTKLNIPGFKTYRQDRLTLGGGVAIAVKHDIKHCLLPTITNINIENLGIELLINNRKITLVSVYNPPSNTSFKRDMKTITDKYREYIIFGDLNAKHRSWNCVSTNNSGNILFNLQLTSNFFIYYPGSPTRYPQGNSPAKPSTIDLLLSNSNLNISNLISHEYQLSSDHVPVTCSINGECNKISNNIPNYKIADWNKFKNCISTKIDSLNLNNLPLYESNVDFILEKLISIVQSANDEIPKMRYQGLNMKLSQRTLLCIRQRNKYRRKLHRTNDLCAKAILSSITKQVNQLVKENIRIDRNRNWDTFLSSMKTGSQSFWKVTKKLNNSRKVGIPYLRVNNLDVFDDEQKVNYIADNFEKSHSLTTNMHHSVEKKVKRMLNTLQNHLDPNNDKNSYTSVDEILGIIKEQKNGKAPGNDKINSIMIKQIPEIALKLLCKIFNYCLKYSFFPDTFKIAKIVPVYKPGKDAKDPTSYRPISMLSTLSKVFEKIIHRRLTLFISDNNIINKEQFGFRPHHSTVHQIKRVTNIIKKNKIEKKSTGMVLLDIEKAFDSIWHDGLVYKLAVNNTPIYLTKLIRSFLQNRKFRVILNNQESTTRNIIAGVPQGSVLSPTLFSIYIADFKKTKNLETAFYADDSINIISGKNSNAIIKKLNTSLEYTNRFFKKWKIKVNTSKTQLILFPYNKSPKRTPSVRLKFNDSIVPMEKNVKYLGMHLDNKLTFKDHIEKSCTKALNCLKSVYPLIGPKSKLSVKNKLLIYKVCIRPKLTYACAVWKNAAKTNLAKLQIVQNKALKMSYGLNRRFPTLLLHEQYHQDLLKDVIEKLNISFSSRCRNSSYELIHELAD